MWCFKTVAFRLLLFNRSNIWFIFLSSESHFYEIDFFLLGVDACFFNISHSHLRVWILCHAFRISVFKWHYYCICLSSVDCNSNCIWTSGGELKPDEEFAYHSHWLKCKIEPCPVHPYGNSTKRLHIVFKNLNVKSGRIHMGTGLFCCWIPVIVMLLAPNSISEYLSRSECYKERNECKIRLKITLVSGL